MCYDMGSIFKCKYLGMSVLQDFEVLPLYENNDESYCLFFHHQHIRQNKMTGAEIANLITIAKRQTAPNYSKID